MKYWIVLLLYLNGFILPTLANSYSVEQSYSISQENSSQNQWEKEIKAFIKKFTVKIITDDKIGLGIIIHQNQDRYLVLTTLDLNTITSTPTIITEDGNSHSAIIVGNDSIPNFSVLMFQSQQKYSIAYLESDEANLQEGKEILVMGISENKLENFSQTELIFSQGKVEKVLDKPLRKGYQIGYSSSLSHELIGSAIIDIETAKVIGLQGLNANSKIGDYLNKIEDYLNTNNSNNSFLSIDTIRKIEIMRQLSWAISINKNIEQVKQKLIEDDNFIRYIQSINEDLMKPACQASSLFNLGQGCLNFPNIGGIFSTFSPSNGLSDQALRELIQQAQRLLAISDFKAALAKYKEVERGCQEKLNQESSSRECTPQHYQQIQKIIQYLEILIKN